MLLLSLSFEPQATSPKAHGTIKSIAKTNDFIHSKPDFVFLEEDVKSISSSSLLCQKMALWGFWGQSYKNVFKKYPSKDLIYKDSNGKPRAKNDEFFFSVSHTKDLLAIVFSNSSVGIDIEQHKENINLEKLIKRVSAKNEIIKNDVGSFFDVWTKKEAIFKFHGTSSTFIPKNIICDGAYNNTKTYRLKFLDKTYSLSIAFKFDFDCKIQINCHKDIIF